MAFAAPLVRTSAAPSSRVAERLDTARRTVEGRFLQAGEVLAQAVEGLGRLIASLDQMGAAMDSQTVDTLTAELEAAAADLQALPARHQGRRHAIEALAQAGERLADGVEEMRRTLAYLRVFAINIKITAGGIAAAGTEFGDFAQEICDRIELGRGELHAFDAEVQALRDVFKAALAHEVSLASQCDRMLPAVPEGLGVSARAVVSQHQRVAQVAVEVGSLARAVQKKVGSALAALQIGDITRQRIEHVSQALDLLAAERNLDGDRGARLTAFIHGLLAAQLRATAEDFHRDVARIGAAMDGIAGDAAEILRLRDLALGRTEADGTGFLRRLEGHVGQALTLVDDMASADRSAREAGASAAVAAAGLNARISGLSAIKTEVQQMALNTTLKCSRLGDPGKPLAVIAIELRTHAGYMETASQAALTALGGLSDGPGLDAGEDGADLAAGVGAALSDVSARLHTAGDAVESDLASLAKQGQAVVEGLRRAAARMDFQREIGAVLDEAAAALASGLGSAPPRTNDLAQPLGDLLARIARSYTMAQEREVHAARTADLSFETDAPGGPAAETDDDVLF